MTGWDSLEKRSFTMTVKDVMTQRVATCRPETNLAEAAALMWENDCGALPVVAETGELAGIITDRDICIALGTRNVRSSDLCVRDVIKDHPLVCKSSDDIHAALRTMHDGKIRRLPVVGDNASLEGIVSMDDVVLNAAHGNGKLDHGVSFGDVVTTLQGIYIHDHRERSATA
jgi:CBS domain-containing protein